MAKDPKHRKTTRKDRATKAALRASGFCVHDGARRTTYVNLNENERQKTETCQKCGAVAQTVVEPRPDRPRRRS